MEQYLPTRRVKRRPLPPNQQSRLLDLHILHIARGEAVNREEDVGATGLFDEAVITEGRVRGAFAGFAFVVRCLFGLLLQLVARVVGRFDFGGRVLAQPLLVGSGVAGFVGVGGVVEALEVCFVSAIAWEESAWFTSISSGVSFLYSADVSLACSVAETPLPLVSTDRTR